MADPQGALYQQLLGDEAMQTAALGRAGKGQSPAPVHLWDPPFCGDLDLVITQDGRWLHEGALMTRMPLVRMFANILKREGEAYFLVSPVEKLRIRVEDVPFIAVDIDYEAAQEPIFWVTTALGDRVAVGPDHPLRFAAPPQADPETLVAYVEIRSGLEARLDRKSSYRLAEHVSEDELDGEVWLGIRSGGAFFRWMPAAAL